MEIQKLKNHSELDRRRWAAQVVWRALVDMSTAFEILGLDRDTIIGRGCAANRVKRVSAILNRAVLDADRLDSHDVLLSVYDIFDVPREV